GESPLLATSDAAMRVQAFEDEFTGGSAHGVGLVGGEAERLGFFHESLNAVQAAYHRGRIDRFIELERSAEVEPLDDLRDVGAFEVMVVDLADGDADEFARHGVAALELAFVLELELPGDGGQRGVQVENARHGNVLFGFEGAAFGIGDDVFEHGD